MTKWTFPSKKSFEKEYKIEVEIKGNDFFESLEQFMSAVDCSEVITVDGLTDAGIEYRSHTKTQSQLLNLIRGYRSYPQYRNEATLQNLYDRIRSGQEMDMPIILEFRDGSLRILSGNTRADVAMQIDGEYQAVKITI